MTSWVTIIVVRAEPVVQGAVVAAESVAGGRVEGAERLVHQHHGRARAERARHADALPLAAGQAPRAREPPTSRGRATRSSSSPTRSAIFGRDQPARRGPTAMFSAHRHVGKQADFLEDVADPPPQRPKRFVARRAALDDDRAVVGRDQAVDHLQRRGLAAAGAAEQGDELPLGDLERQGSDDAAPVPGFATLENADHAAWVPPGGRPREGRRQDYRQDA